MSKKGAKASKETKEMSYQIRDIVLGKIRGYPPWPGMVVDPENVPPSVTSERPSSKKTTFYCVRFFPTGDYAWLVPKDISKLQTHEIESYINEPFKKSADLLQGYRIALNPQKWEEEHDALTHEAVEAEANAEIDQLEESEHDEDAEDEPKKKTSKKRKRESEQASAVSTKGKKKAPKEKKEKDESAPSGNGKKKSASTAGAKGKKNGAKGKTMVESEDEGEHDGSSNGQDTNAATSKKQAASASGATSPPPAKKAKRDKEEEEEPKDAEANKVRDWRHKLQKAFLGKTAPKDEDMPGLDALFTTVEDYEGMTVEYLTFSKIGKVMRHIAVLTDDKVPRDDEYHFRERAKSLVDRWHQILNANKTASAAPIALSTAPALSIAPISVPPNIGTTVNGNGSDQEESKSEAKEEEKQESKDEDKDEKDVTEGTAALDLNGKQDDTSPTAEGTSTAGEDAPADADTSVADVTMSEA